MKAFLKKYIKPSLCTMGIYTFAYRCYFFLLFLKTKIINRFNKLFCKTAPILLYHRVATLSNDPINLAITPKCFEEHLIFFKKNYDILSLSELSKRLTTGTLKGNEAAITFDDGYKDNFTNALPLLEKYNVPATIFVTTGSLGEKASFEWDMQYAETDRATFLNNTELKILSNHPLIEIGTHTATHPRLANLTEEEQKNDILKGKNKLEEILNKKIKLFAYPFGNIYDFTNLSQKIVKEVGFDFAYSNTQNLAKVTKNSFCISRINIRECTIFSLSQKIMCGKNDLQD